MSLFRLFTREREKDTLRKETVAAALPPPPAPSVVPPNTAPAVAAPPSPSAPPPPLDLERIRRELQQIALILGADGPGDEAGAVSSEYTALSIPLGEIMRICPSAFKSPANLDAVRDTRLTVEVPRLFEQLAKGRVSTTVNLLLADVPMDFLVDDLAQRDGEEVSIPLALAVSAVDPAELRRRTTVVERDLGEGMLPNLFAPTSAAAPAAAAATAERPPAAPATADETVAAEAVALPPPAVEAPPPEPAAEPIAEPEAAPAPAHAPDAISVPDEVSTVHAPPETGLADEDLRPMETAAPVLEPVSADTFAGLALPPPAPEAAAPPPDVDLEATTHRAEDLAATVEALPEARAVLVAGLDINTATAADFVARFTGVGLRLATKIVAEREAGGPFVDVFDLARVPGLRGRRFTAVTGRPWAEAYFAQRAQVRQVVGPPSHMIPDVRQVARAFQALPGFQGCLIIHEDGLLLSQSWDHPASEALGAFAPQMFKKLSRYVRQLRMGQVRCISFFVDELPVTLVHQGCVLLAALHAPRGFTRKNVRIVQAITAELGRRLSG